ncbi:MAG TPA: Wzz/FepE/Etk N-terminal domain-containing protein [Kineosporiaceae bacterium]
MLPEAPSVSDVSSSGLEEPSLAASLWRYRRVIATVAAIAAISGFAVALLLPARYAAEATVIPRDPGTPAALTLDGSSRSGDHDVFMATQAEIAGSDPVLGRALRALKRSETPDAMRQSVGVSTSSDRASVVIRATSATPDDAVRVANAVGAAYQQVSGERMDAEFEDVLTRLERVRHQREAELDSIQTAKARSSGAAAATLDRRALFVANLIGAIQVHEDDIASDAAVYGSGIQMFRPAVKAQPSQPKPVLIALFGGVLGLVVAAGWAWRAAGRDRRVEADGDSEAILGVPRLGEIPKPGATSRTRGEPTPWPNEPDPDTAEAYHVLLASLRHAMSRTGGKVVAASSATPDAGATPTVLNLAIAARREGCKVLLVDADERTHRLSLLCGEGDTFDVITVKSDGSECSTVGPDGAVLQIARTEQNGRHPALFFRSPPFRRLVRACVESADLVLIDTPAVLAASETVTIADSADAVLLVVHRGTPLADLKRVRERLAVTDTPLAGYVLHQAPVHHRPRGGYRFGWPRRQRGSQVRGENAAQSVTSHREERWPTHASPRS